MRLIHSWLFGYRTKSNKDVIVSAQRETTPQKGKSHAIIFMTVVDALMITYNLQTQNNIMIMNFRVFTEGN